MLRAVVVPAAGGSRMNSVAGMSLQAESSGKRCSQAMQLRKEPDPWQDPKSRSPNSGL